MVWCIPQRDFVEFMTKSSWWITVQGEALQGGSTMPIILYPTVIAIFILIGEFITTQKWHTTIALQWRNNEFYGIPNYQPHNCLLSRLFRHRSKKALKLRGTGLCKGNSPVPGEFPAQKASIAETIAMWWHHNANQMINKSIQKHRNNISEHSLRSCVCFNF